MNKLKLVTMAFMIALLIAVSTASLATAAPASGEDPSASQFIVNPSDYDISDLTCSKVNARQAAESWRRAMGFNGNADELKTYYLLNGQNLIVSPGTDVELRRAVGEDGNVKLDFSISTPQFSTPKAGVIQAAAPYDQVVAHEAFARLEDSHGWMDMAYILHKVGDDGNCDEDFYTLQNWATACAKRCHSWDSGRINKAWVNCQKKDGSCDMNWYDWCPRSDSTVPVPGTSTTVGLNVCGVILSQTYTQCETWDITKYEEAGRFENCWKGSAYKSEREVAYMAGIWVTQGGWPIWNLRYGYSWP